MTGSIYQATAESSYGERDGRITVTFLRSGDLSGAVNVVFDVTGESATPGVDFIAPATNTTRFEPGSDRATVTFDIVNDALSEATETFIVSIVSIDSGTFSVPRTTRVNILDDENPVTPPAQPPLVQEYKVVAQPLVSGLNQPVNIEFSPVDPNIIYVAEKGGLVRVFNIQSGEDLGIMLDIKSQVNEYGDRGLMDIALHPDFVNNPYVYAFYVVEPAGLALPDQPGNRFAHVVRYTADAATNYTTLVAGSGVIIAGGTGTTTADINDGGLIEYDEQQYATKVGSERYINPNDPTPPTLVIDGIKQNYIKVDSVTHAGGSLAFGPDGALYISVGDGSSANYADPHTVEVQNLNSMNGKILRVDPLTGRGMTDNPFYQAGQSLDSNISKVYQYGLRNPFSIAFDPLGRLFITDTGWNAYEEINTGPRGANFGWPFYEGKEGGVSAQTTGYKDLPQAAAFYQGVANGTIKVTAPYAAFGHAEAVPGFQNQAITGGSVIYTGGRYPEEFNDDYFFSNFPFARTFTIDTNNRQDINYLYTSTSTFGAVHYTQGPDGYVYYADLGAYEDGFSSTDGLIGRLLIGALNAPQVTVTTNTPTVTEGAGAVATATFTLSAAQTAPVVLTYATANSGAVAGSDFTGVTNASVTINPGQTSVTVSVALIDDTVFERLEKFAIVLTGATLNGAPFLGAGAAAITVLDNDPPPPGTNLLLNGSLESPTVASGGAVGYTAIPNWTGISGGSGVELWNGHQGVAANTGAGSNYAELDFDTARDGFYQDVQTIAGQVYTLSFDQRLRPGIPATTSGVEVVWNNTLVTTTTPGANWATFSVNVTGTGGQNRLTIREVASQGGDGVGALVDNFKLIPVGPAGPAVTVSAAPLSVTEGAGVTTTVTFTLNQAQSAPVTVNYSTTNGTAVAGSDFTGATNASVVIPTGQTSVSVTVPILDDTTFESTETFAVTLNGATLNGAAIAASGSATITILDNDPPPAGTNLLVNGSLEQPTLAASAAAGYASIPGWTAITGGTIEIWNALNGVTATAGVNFAELDYIGARDGFYQDVQTVAGQSYTLTFDQRLRPGTAATTSGVEVVWNNTVIATTTPGAAWAGVTFNVTGTGAQDRLTIREVDTQGGDGLGAMLDNFKLVAAGPALPTVTIAATPLTVTEGAGAFTTATFTLSAAQSSPVTVTYSTANGTAIAGSDFTGATNATVVIPTGQTSVSVNIAITDDAVFEQQESFGVTLNGATLNGAALTATGTATIQIVDNDPPPASVSISATPLSLNEAAGAFTTVTFTLNAAQAAPVTVTYSTTNGTAVAGSDFTGATNATVVIPTGQTSVSVTVPLVDDTVAESTETFGVTLNGATLNGSAIAASGSATITILDTDPPPAGTNLLTNGSFETPTVAAGGASFQTTVPGWTAITGGTIEIWNALNGVTATAGANFLELDYVGARDGFYQDVQTVAGQTYTLTFDQRLRPGIAATTSGVEVVWNNTVVTTTPTANWATFTLTVTGTGAADRLTIREVASQGGDGLGPLLDNFKLVAAGPPLPTVTIAATPLTVTEGAGAFTTATFTLSAAQSAPVTVTYSTTNGAAVAGSDFTGATNTTVVIPTGQTSVSVTVPIIDDAVFEQQESFGITLNGATLNGTALTATGTATIQIIDNDPAPPSVSISATPLTVTEGASAFTTVTFALTAAQAAPVIVTYSTANGTAVAGSDFTGANNATVEIPAGQTSVSVTVPITDDAVFEQQESFGVTLNGATLNGAALTATGTATIQIVDNDPPPASVSISATPLSLNEAAGAFTTVTFTLNAAQAAPVTVTYSTTNGTAVAGSDFTGATNATVVIPTGQTSVSVTVPLIDDTVAESTETFGVTLNGATLNGNAIAASGSATITILDTDPPPAGTNLLTNGSLEQPTLAAGSAAGYASIPGWTAITGGTIEIWNALNGVAATAGANFAELDYVGARDGFYQDVQTIAGQAYTLTFDQRLRPGIAATTSGVEVVWNNTVVATTTPGAAWAGVTFNVTGTGALDRLTIREVSTQGGDGLGALLDNFKLVTAGPPVPAVTISATPLTVTEAAGALTTVTFSLNVAQSAPVTVTYSTTNGTAVAGSDFTGATNATVVIPAGQTSVAVTIPIINDAVFEQTETFGVTLNGATVNGAAIAATGTATITVLDTDPPPTGTNLLVNGSLEQPTVAVGASVGYPSIPGWTAITGGTIELWNAHGGNVASAGVNFAELDYAGARDGFYQDVQTVAGETYTLTFDERLRPGGAVGTSGVEVVWNNTVVATTTPASAAWTTFTITVTGTGALDRLTIREVQAQSADGLGALVDNFKLVSNAPAPLAAEATPQAATFSLASTASDTFVYVPPASDSASAKSMVATNDAAVIPEATSAAVPISHSETDVLPLDADMSMPHHTHHDFLLGV